MKLINHPDGTQIKLKNRRIFVYTIKENIFIYTKNLFKGREIYETTTQYSKEGATALLVALHKELSKY